MTEIQATLLGRFHFCVGGTDVHLPGQKDQALLAYLSLNHGKEHQRERLAGLLWGESETARARDSLKHALARVREALGPASDALKISRNTVTFNPEEMFLDVEKFADRAQRETQDALEQALELYKGDLLADMMVDEPGFDEWLAVARHQLRLSADFVIGRTLAYYAENSSPEEALSAARRALAIDPLNERACRLLIRTLASVADTTQAIATYKAFASRLEDELGIAPEPETSKLFEELLLRRKLRRAGSSSSASKETEIENGKEAVIPSRPSVAVLSFKSLGIEDYFADGMAEEITTVLSRVRGIVLIARNSSFNFSEREASVTEIGQALSAQYLVKGKIMLADDRIRINVSLLDAKAGTVIWSEAFQDDRRNLFELQERIATQVAGILLPKVEAAEIERVSSGARASADAYDYYLRGLARMHRWTEKDSEAAIALFEKASQLAPDFAAAYGMAVRCYSQRKASGWVRDRERETAEAVRLARLATDFANDDALPLCMAGIGYGFVAGEPEKGVRLIERALQLNPNLAYAWYFSGWLNVWLGLHETALEHFATAMRLSPQDPQFEMMQTGTACAHFFSGRPQEAVNWAEQAVLVQPNYWIAWCVLAAASAATGAVDTAREAMDHVLKIDTALHVRNLKDAFPLRKAKDIEIWTSSLTIAGLPS